MVAPLHTAGIASKLGVTCGVTSRSAWPWWHRYFLLRKGIGGGSRVVDGGTPGAGNAFLDVAGSVMVAPLHTAGIASKLGVTCGVTVTVSVAVVAQVFPVGVKV
jgi:hypothetical protein